MHRLNRGISILVLCFLTPSWAYAQTQGGFLYRCDDDTQLDVEILRGLSAIGTDWGYGIGISSRY